MSDPPATFRQLVTDSEGILAERDRLVTELERLMTEDSRLYMVGRRLAGHADAVERVNQRRRWLELMVTQVEDALLGIADELDRLAGLMRKTEP